MVYYAVANGRTIGVFKTWTECKESVNGFKHACFKKFNTKAEAEAFVVENKVENKIIVEEPKEPKEQEEQEAPKEIASIDDVAEDDFKPDYYVYTDGACSNNGRKNAMAGIGIYFGKDDPRNVSREVVGKQTNNTAELTAIIETFYIIEDDLDNNMNVCIVSDSEYAIRCVTSYGKKCDASGWKKKMPNKELVKTVYQLYKDRTNVRFKHIMAHTSKTDIHSLGNDKADLLANMAIGEVSCPYN